MSHADATMDAPDTRAVVQPVAPPAAQGSHLPPETVRLLGVLMVGAFAADESVHAIRVGPVGLHGNRREPVMFDQVFRDARAQMIEVLRPV